MPGKLDAKLTWRVEVPDVNVISDYFARDNRLAFTVALLL